MREAGAGADALGADLSVEVDPVELVRDEPTG